MSRLKRAEIELDIAIRSLEKIVKLMNDYVLPVNEKYQKKQHEEDVETILKTVDLLKEFLDEIEEREP